MAYDNATAHETIELFGLTEKGAVLPIPEDDILKDTITREAFEALLIAQSEAMVADPPTLFALAPTCISRMEAAGF